MTAYVVQINYPDTMPVWLGRVGDSEYGYAFSVDTAERFPDPDTAVRTAVGWAESLEQWAEAVEVES